MDLLRTDDVNISGITSIAGDFNVGSSGTTFHVDTTRGLAGVGTNAPDFLYTSMVQHQLEPQHFM